MNSEDRQALHRRATGAHHGAHHGADDADMVASVAVLSAAPMPMRLPGIELNPLELALGLDVTVLPEEAITTYFPDHAALRCA